MSGLQRSLILSTFLFLHSTFLHASTDPIYNYIIKDATIFDGESYRSTRADVGILRDEIGFIGDLSEAEAFETIDASGLILAPGFIDAHTHSDFNPFIYPDLPNKVRQGVTTEVVGNCGMSAAPILGLHAGHVHDVWVREGVTIPPAIAWTTFREYKEALEAETLTHNWVGLIGHGNIRAAVMGVDPRSATPTEMLRMKEMIGEAMEQGAMGISFGLIYIPGIFASEEELVELCHEAAKHSGVCAFHIRSEGDELLDAIKEAIRVGRKAKARIQISHFKAAGPKQKRLERIEKAFELIERARRDGMEVTADAYPYRAGFAELGVVLPEHLYTRPDRIQLFRDPLKRLDLLNELRAYYEKRRMKWGWIRIGSTPNQKYWPHEGKSIQEIAVDNDIEPEKFLIDILGESDFKVSAFYFSQSEEVVRRVMKKNYVAIGSDSVADGSRRPHPRAFGSFPRVLRRYVQENKDLRLGEAIRKMTSLPARQFRIAKRGRVIESYFADLVLFDASEVADQATYEKPTEAPAGIEWVFVNGKPVVAKGQDTGKRPGKVLAFQAPPNYL